MTIIALFRQSRLYPRWQRWLAHRLPAAKQQTLSHKGIFILPTAFGLCWLTLAMMLYLFGINYQNNLIIALALLMASLFTSCAVLGYRNLAGLELRLGNLPQVYADETLAVPINLSSQHLSWQIQLGFTDNIPEQLARVTAKAAPTAIAYRQTRRGKLSPGRLCISSQYPMGLCRVWSLQDMAIEHLVFAKPIEPDSATIYRQHQQASQQANGAPVNGVDEFSGLRAYVSGESLKQVAWKQWAQGRGMLVKEFQQPQHHCIWLTLPQSQADDLERHISALSYLVEFYCQRQQSFGLRLAETVIAPGCDETHRQSCQHALAMYPPAGKYADAPNHHSAPEFSPKHTDKVSFTAAHQETDRCS